MLGEESDGGTEAQRASGQRGPASLMERCEWVGGDWEAALRPSA